MQYSGNEDTSAFEADAGKAKELSVDNFLAHIFCESFFAAAARNEILQIVVCSIFFSIGIILTPQPQAKKMMLSFCESLSLIMFKVTQIVMLSTPFAVFGALAETIAVQGPTVLLNIGKLIGSLYLALFIFIFGVLFPILLATRIPVRRFLRAIYQPFLIAFTTASSEAALPLAMENMQRLGVSKSVVAFVMPTGFSFNLDGTTLYLSMAAVFAAQTKGIEQTLGEQLVMMLTLMLTSKGVAAVSRASLVVLSGTLTQFNLPLEAVALIVAGDQIMDMGRAAVNLLGNCLATAVMAKWEGELDLAVDFDRDVGEEEPELGGTSDDRDLEEQMKLIESGHLH